MWGRTLSVLCGMFFVITATSSMAGGNEAGRVGVANREISAKLLTLISTDLQSPKQPKSVDTLKVKNQALLGSNSYHASTLRGMASQSGIQIYIPDQERIFGGDLAQPQELPWQVAILNRQYGTLVCGGSYIGGGWILTAAHCVDRGTRAEDLAVLYGSTSLTSGGRRIPVKSIVLNSQWSHATLKNDIALIKTDVPDQIPAVNVASQKTESPYLLPGKKLMVSGWGTTAPDGTISVNLMRVLVPVVALTMCNGSYDNELTDTQLCAGEADKDSCQGDSGGPLTGVGDGGIKILVGIVSYGKGCGLKGNPGVYTRVSAYDDWIRANTGLNVANE